MKNQIAENCTFGIHPVTELVENQPERIDHLYFEQDRQSLPLFELMKTCRARRLAYQVLPRNRLDQLTGTDKHQGVVAVCSAKPYTTTEEFERLIAGKDAPLLFLPASIEDPRNLGALIRSCVAFGVDAMLLERRNTAPLSSTVAKSSAGMLEHMPIVKPKNLEGLVGSLRDKGFGVIGAVAGAPYEPSSVDLTSPTIIVTGGEHRGVPPYLQKQCTALVGIPIDPRAESLNVSVAGAILLYECRRQRKLRNSDCGLQIEKKGSVSS
jgi:23S rRNA (guanosine2251-2'-O)-methyltransferase